MDCLKQGVGCRISAIFTKFMNTTELFNCLLRTDNSIMGQRVSDCLNGCLPVEGPGVIQARKDLIKPNNEGFIVPLVGGNERLFGSPFRPVIIEPDKNDLGMLGLILNPNSFAAMWASTIEYPITSRLAEIEMTQVRAVAEPSLLYCLNKLGGALDRVAGRVITRDKYSDYISYITGQKR